ncbi:MAG: serpin family protein [candidate division Zixibacteria bacterium]|nr:serpin family protein [candidate division Zixibacteria bacterium]
MRKYIGLLLIVAVGLLFLQCSSSTEPEPNGTDDRGSHRTPAELTAAEKNLAGASNEFSFKLFRKVVADEPAATNVFISPLSVSFALGMTQNGAKGDTRDSMRAVLELAGLTDQEINEAYQGLTDVLVHLDPNVVFSLANSIWYRENKPIVPDFLEQCRTYFDAEVRKMDFQAPGAADIINHWVDVNTNGKITEIIKPPIPASIAMLLMNAIYFKGNWTIPFDPEETVAGKFKLPDGSLSDCEMMVKNSFEDTTFEFSYFENDLFQAVDLAYGKKAFSMTVLLPKLPADVDDIMNELSPENWATWMGSFSDEEIFFQMPKFKFEYEKELREILEAMGMSIAFDASRADFSNMFGDGAGWIDKVKHKTFVQVDEKGTEAAAVTVVVMIDSAPQPMIVDRPFVFVIHEHESGTIIFMGKVADPEWQE